MAETPQNPTTAPQTQTQAPAQTPPSTGAASPGQDWEKALRDAFSATDNNKTGFDLFSLIFGLLFGKTPDFSNPPDFEDAQTPEELARDRQEYRSSGREASDDAHTQSEPYRQWKPSSLADTKKFTDLRAQVEAANGGKHVDSISPVDGGRVTSPFGHRDADATGGVGSTEHKGLDIGPPAAGTSVSIRAPMAGFVTGKGWVNGYGNTLQITDVYGVSHFFGHLASSDVQLGQQVAQGQKVAMMGSTGHSTGIHTHYEQRGGDDHARDPIIAGQTWHTRNSVLPTFNGSEPQLAAAAPAKPPAHDPAHAGKALAAADVAHQPGAHSPQLHPLAVALAAGKAQPTRA